MLPHSQRGFTLIELLVVTALIAIVASIAIPMVKSSRIRANEAACVRTLKTIATQQVQLRTGRALDANGNGRGEYGYFQELSGARRMKTGSPASGEGLVTLAPPLLSGAFQKIDDQGRLLRSGYFFRIFLPGNAGSWLGEQGVGTAYPAVDANFAETQWACYAWPGSYEQSGTQVYFINHQGELLSAKNNMTRYEGSKPPPVVAVLKATAIKKTSMNHSLAINSTGTDGNFWKVQS